jgi:putative ABC transport system permease protein
MKAALDFFLSIANDPVRLFAVAGLIIVPLLLAYYRKATLFIVKSLARNMLRTILTSMAIFVLVFVVTLVWSILSFISLVTDEKSKDFKAIVTERWQIPSQMPYSHATTMDENSGFWQGKEGKPTDIMTWSFFGGTLDPANRTRENTVFFFCMEPAKLLSKGKDGKWVTMMDGLDEFSEADRERLYAACKAMEQDRRRVLIGEERLAAMNKKVGDRIKVTSFNYQDIVMDECEIIGSFPKGRYGQTGVMHRDRLLNLLDNYKLQNKGQAHPLADKSLNLVWLKVPDTATYNQVAKEIEEAPQFTSPAVKVETGSSGIASFLDAYRDLLWGMRWLLVPSILATMAMVIANAISISVRERRTEMAVLKVLGYGPNHILGLVLGEALLLGCGAGLLSSGLTYLFVTQLMGGLAFPIAFFPRFLVPIDALWWGLTVGAGTSLLGSFLPAWSARSVKVSEVFSKIS